MNVKQPRGDHALPAGGGIDAHQRDWEFAPTIKYSGGLTPHPAADRDIGPTTAHQPAQDSPMDYSPVAEGDFLPIVDGVVFGLSNAFVLPA